jgi:hypothetical protein
MPSELNRRAVLVAIAAFVLALAVAYALSSTGQASEGTGDTPGSAATPLDVSSSVAGQSTLGDAPALPAMVARPQPEPEPEPEPEEEEPAVEAPQVIVTPPPPVSNPAPVDTPPPPPPEPEVEFDDSG